MGAAASRYLTAFFLLCYAHVSGAAIIVLTGTVVDLGTDPPRGIPGVSIVIKDARDKSLANGLTDPRGMYSITVIAPSTRGLVAEYRKTGFQPDPRPEPITNLKTELRVVLSKEGASAAYYETLARNMSSKERTQRERQATAEAVAALPSSDKSHILAGLKKTGDARVLQEIQVAENARMVSTQVKAKLVADQQLANRPIRVYSVPDFAGAVRLEGAVNMQYEKLRAGELAKSVGGVRDVQNDISVRK